MPTPSSPPSRTRARPSASSDPRRPFGSPRIETNHDDLVFGRGRRRSGGGEIRDSRLGVGESGEWRVENGEWRTGKSVAAPCTTLLPPRESCRRRRPRGPFRRLGRSPSRPRTPSARFAGTSPTRGGGEPCCRAATKTRRPCDPGFSRSPDHLTPALAFGNAEGATNRRPPFGSRRCSNPGCRRPARISRGARGRPADRSSPARATGSPPAGGSGRG